MNTKTATKPAAEKQPPEVKHELPLEPDPKTQSVAVVETPKQEVAPIDWKDDLAAMSGAGFEDVKAGDMAMPFFKLLQSSSGECKRSEPTYVNGALEGMWFDTISKEFFDEIDFVPCRMVTHYIEWDATKIGVFVKNHGTDDTVMKTTKIDPKTGANVTDHDTRIVPTATWFGIVIGGVKDKGNKEREKEVAGLDRRCVITLSGTQQKVSRRWVSDASSIRLTDSKGQTFVPPLFAMSYRLGKAATKNDQGSWFLATVSRAGWTLDYANGKQVLAAAIEFSKIAKDLQPAIFEDEVPATAQGGNGQQRGSRSSGPRDDVPPPTDDDIPF